jgi:hypothetical protein
MKAYYKNRLGGESPELDAIYFSRYLPLERELGIGDRYLNPRLSFVNTVKTEEDLRICQEQACYPVELCICCHSVCEGDRVYCELYELIPGSHYVVAKTENEIYDYSDSRNIVAVIGPVSKEAHYVYEGMWFLEKEILGWYVDINEGIQIGNPLEKQPDYIKILGPCGHFH